MERRRDKLLKVIQWLVFRSPDPERGLRNRLVIKRLQALVLRSLILPQSGDKLRPAYQLHFLNFCGQLFPPRSHLVYTQTHIKRRSAASLIEHMLINFIRLVHKHVFV